MDNLHNSLGAYVLIINILGFFTAGYDKLKAKYGKWRVPERRLFLLALMGGAIGVYTGMKVFHHKTKHRLFTVGIPVLIIINIIFAYFLLKHF